jgi:hypothetical protein
MSSNLPAIAFIAGCSILISSLIILLVYILVRRKRTARERKISESLYSAQPAFLRLNTKTVVDEAMDVGSLLSQGSSRKSPTGSFPADLPIQATRAPPPSVPKNSTRPSRPQDFELHQGSIFLRRHESISFNEHLKMQQNMMKGQHKTLKQQSVKIHREKADSLFFRDPFEMLQ